MQKLAWFFAALLILVGILGFIPSLAPNGNLFGIFEVGILHNLVHLVTGLVFAYVASASAKASRTAFKVFGVVYALVAVIGLAQGDTVLGLIDTNMADHLLHVVAAVVFLYVGFGIKEKHSMAENGTMPSM